MKELLFMLGVPTDVQILVTTRMLSRHHLNSFLAQHPWHEFGLYALKCCNLTFTECHFVLQILPFGYTSWPVGLMDKASASGAGDSRFESWAGHSFSWGSHWKLTMKEPSSKPPETMSRARTCAAVCLCICGKSILEGTNSGYHTTSNYSQHMSWKPSFKTDSAKRPRKLNKTNTPICVKMFFRTMSALQNRWWKHQQESCATLHENPATRNLMPIL